VRFLSLVFLISLALPCFGQDKHPFTFEDMMKLKRVADPEVSPDGKWVIFTVVDVDLDADARRSNVVRDGSCSDSTMIGRKQEVIPSV